MSTFQIYLSTPMLTWAVSHLPCQCSVKCSRWDAPPVLLQGLCTKGATVDEAVTFFHRMVHNDCLVNVITLNIIIKGLDQTKQSNRTVMLLHEMDSSDVGDCQPNVVTFNIVIHGLCKNGLAGEALELFQVMKNKKVTPNIFTYNTLIWGFSLGGNKGTARSLFNEMKWAGIEPNVTLVNILCRQGDLFEAYQLLEIMIERGLKLDIVIYNALMNGLCRMGKAQEALQSLGKMSDFGGNCKPTVITYTTAIDELCRDGLVDRALLAEMMKRSIKPDVYIYNLVIHNLSTVGRREKAMRLTSEMKEKNVVPNCASTMQLLMLYVRMEKLKQLFYLIRCLMMVSNLLLLLTLL